MFCDLVGSTELSARLDPEDLREGIGAYHRAVADVIRGFDGLVAKYMGDGVPVYFGYPRAHEDDAEGAVRAAQPGASCRHAELSVAAPRGNARRPRLAGAASAPGRVRSGYRSIGRTDHCFGRGKRR